MINLTNKIAFNRTSRRLAKHIRDALVLAARTSQVQNDVEGVDLERVTTKTNLPAAFAKFVHGRVLALPNAKLNSDYVESAFRAYEALAGQMAKEDFDVVMNADEYGAYSFKRTYGTQVKRDIGLFLIALHSSGAITLPPTFTWPQARDESGRRIEIGKDVSSELLAFVRSLDSQSETLVHPAFAAIGGDRKRREWFLTYATKLLLATGWHRPEDANLGDFLKIKAEEKLIDSTKNNPFAYGPLLDVINKAFPGRIKVTSAGWAKVVTSSFVGTVPVNGVRTPIAQALSQLSNNGQRPDIDLLEDTQRYTASWGYTKRIRHIGNISGLDFDVKAMSKLWLDLQELYISKVRRESYKQFNLSMGWLNIYLFFYLPHWFARNPSTALVYPCSPSMLLKSAFVSRLLPTNEERPVTFMEFMNAQAASREWDDNTYYQTLSQVEKFFSFIEKYSEEIHGCEGFVQPLTSIDYPTSSRPRSTRKTPIPRRLFAVFIDYHEALLAHLNMVLHAVLAGDISSRQLERLGRGNIIDTFATAEEVGFIPVLFTSEKTIPLRIIPNVLDTDVVELHGGHSMRLPHPHALHQNLVMLHTGIRGNHIQWLDLDTFDSYVQDGDVEFSTLFVNTDKMMKKPWTPRVGFRVIELLRAQRDWRVRIANPCFDEKKFYNNNPSTKWPAFRPLFSYTGKGQPHCDEVYGDGWKAALCGLQGLMPELSEFGQSKQLVYLLPPNFKPGESQLKQKLADYGAGFTKLGESCPLRVFALMTPHSARVSVVSQYIPFLPVDLIGKCITGQKPGTVVFYVHLDEDTVRLEQFHQAARMREAMLRGTCEPTLTGRTGLATTFIHADAVNSNLARSIKADFEQTIKLYGGMSISFSQREKDGIDVCRETQCADVAFNKTEICPFGNKCPPEVVKELGGIRRCSLCFYAVRFIDHLPAIGAKKRQMLDALVELETELNLGATALNEKYTPVELDSLDEEKARVSEELTGWILSEEVLELMRGRIAAGVDHRTWTVQRPEIIERRLKQVSVQTTESEYLLSRLGECIAFPMLESPQIRARFDLLRRELLVRAGQMRDAFGPPPKDTTLECAGLLKTVIESTGMSVIQLAEALNTRDDIERLSAPEFRILAVEDMS